MRIETADLSRHDPLARRIDCHDRSRPFTLWIDSNLIYPHGLPSGAYAACLLRPPESLGDGRWRWRAAGGAGTESHEDELLARIDGERIEWTFWITGTRRGLDRFLWIAGESDTSGTRGRWGFFDPAGAAPRDTALAVEWEIDPSGDGRSMERYRNLDPESTGTRGSMIETVSADSIALTWLDVEGAEVRRLRLAWSRSDGGGVYVDSRGNRCCWGEREAGYPDAACP